MPRLRSSISERKPSGSFGRPTTLPPPRRRFERPGFRRSRPCGSATGADLELASIQMKLVIVGCGRVGAMAATALAKAGHQVTVIDNNRRAFDRLGSDFPG